MYKKAQRRAAGDRSTSKYTEKYVSMSKNVSFGPLIPTVSKRTGPTVFSLKSEPFIPSRGNFQGIIFHPCMVYHINFIIISYLVKIVESEQFEKK